jgi:hypothetical protein
VTLYEIGGPYNSIIVGLANMVGAVSGFLGPLIVGVLTANVNKVSINKQP